MFKDKPAKGVVQVCLAAVLFQARRHLSPTSSSPSMSTPRLSSFTAMRVPARLAHTPNHAPLAVRTAFKIPNAVVPVLSSANCPQILSRPLATLVSTALPLTAHLDSSLLLLLSSSRQPSQPRVPHQAQLSPRPRRSLLLQDHHSPLLLQVRLLPQLYHRTQLGVHLLHLQELLQRTHHQLRLVLLQAIHHQLRPVLLQQLPHRRLLDLHQQPRHLRSPPPALHLRLPPLALLLDPPWRLLPVRSFTLPSLAAQ